MTPEQAQALYFAGEQAVVERLCALDAQVQAAQQQIEALQRKLAQRSKDSLDANQNIPTCARNNGPTECAVDDCLWRLVKGAIGRRSRFGSPRNRTATGGSRTGGVSVGWNRRAVLPGHARTARPGAG